MKKVKLQKASAVSIKLINNGVIVELVRKKGDSNYDTAKTELHYKDFASAFPDINQAMT